MVNLSVRLSVLYPTLAETYAASTVLPGLSICIVLLRFYTRRLQKIPLGIDDWLMVPALAMVVGIGISLVTGIHLKAIAYPTPVDGNLTAEEQFSPANPTISLMYKINYVVLVFIIVAFGFIKLSIIFLYRRLFVTRRGTFFDWVTKISISVVILWTISFFFGFIFGCGTHFSAEWDGFKNYYTYCRVLIDLMNPWVVSDLVSDVMIFCLPLPVVWNLHITTGQKLLVTGILAAGAVSIVAAIAKVIIALYIVNPGYSAHIDFMDIDLNVIAILYWSMVEAGLAIIAACLPNLYFLLHKVSLGSIMNSVRSALSVRSLRSQHSQRIVPRSESSYTNIVPDILSASQMPMTRISGSAGSFRSGNKDAAEITGPGIYVTSQISQHESIV